MAKVVSIIGTRPEAIKMAPVIRELESANSEFESVTCVTAQHREMLDQVLRVFNIVPDIDLNLMQPDQDLTSLTKHVLCQVGQVLEAQRPDILLIQGDTTTVMAAALAASYRKISVGHVEAGLRTENIYSPFPEEINRRLTSVLTSFHFAPTEQAQKALIREGISAERIFVTGNTVIDALRMILEKSNPRSVNDILGHKDLLTNNRKFILVTAHRRENFGIPLEEICRGLELLAKRNQSVFIIYPVHMNPKVREPVFRNLQNINNVCLIDPVDYDLMAQLMNLSYLLLTDSGGIQEEAPALGKPVLVLRTETERPEAVQAGVAKVIGPYCDAIVRETERLLYDRDEYLKMSRAVSPYGDGHAAERIVAILKRLL